MKINLYRIRTTGSTINRNRSNKRNKEKKTITAGCLFAEKTELKREEKNLNPLFRTSISFPLLHFPRKLNKSEILKEKKNIGKEREREYKDKIYYSR